MIPFSKNLMKFQTMKSPMRTNPMSILKSITLRSIGKALFGLGLLGQMAYGACTPNGPATYTTKAGIRQPAINNCGWGADLNNDFGIIDSSFGVLSAANTWASTNTFSQPIIINNAKQLKFFDATTHSINFQAPTTATQTNFTLPGSDGSNGQAIITNGSGVLSFGTVSTSTGIAPGSTNYIQNTSVLQSGATFYVSSGTVQTQLIVGNPGGSYLNLVGPAITGFSANVTPVNDGTLTFTNSSSNGAPKGIRFDNPTTGTWVAGIDTITSIPVSKFRTTIIISSNTSITGGLVVDTGTFTGGVTAGSGTFTTALTVAGQNVCQANGTNCPASGGGGASSLATGVGGPSGYSNQISSPTPGVIFDSNTFVGSLNTGGTAYYHLNPSSVTLQGNNLSATFLTNSSATATYLQQSSAAVTYAPISGSANYIQATSILQSGATFYVSSGTVFTQFNSPGTANFIGTTNIAGANFTKGNNLNIQNTDNTGTAVIQNGGGTSVTSLQITAGNGIGINHAPVNGQDLTLPSLAVTGLTSGQCVQTGTGGLLTVTGSACGSGTGGVTVYPATATASFPFGLSASTFSVQTNTPTIVSNIQEPNMSSAGWVFVRQHYAYATAFSGNSLTVFDVSNPTSPFLVSQATSPSSGGILTGAEGLDISGKYLYQVSLTSSVFNVWDISSPAFPKVVASIVDATNLRGAEAIVIHENYAFVANFNSIAGTQPGITVVDISNPLSPQIVTKLINSNIISPIFLRIRYPYLYETNEDSSCDLNIIDISNPLSLTVNKSFVPTGCNGNLVGEDFLGKYMYLAGSGNFSIFTVDISSPLAPVSISSVPTGTYNPGVLKVLGNRLYSTALLPDGLLEFDLTNPANPIWVSTTTSASLLVRPDDIFTNGQYLYISDHGSGGATGGITIINPGSVYVPGLQAGSIEADDLEVTHDFRTNRAYVDTSLNAVVIGAQIISASTMTASSDTVSGQFTAGTYQGAGLTTCGDGTHAVSWSGGTFGCQTLTGSGGSSGIVSPGTFTWTNAFGINVSTLVVTGTGVSGTTNMATFGSAGNAVNITAGSGVGIGKTPGLGSGSLDVSGLINSDTGIQTSAFSGGYFFQQTNIKPALVMNASGANFGVVENRGATSWDLGYSGANTTLGTQVLTWDSSPAVNVASSMTVSGAKGLSVAFGVSAATGTFSSLSSGQCVQAGTGGLLTTTGSSCGSGDGGSSSLQITQGGVQITFPTSSMNFQTNQFSLAAVVSTSTIALNASSVTLQGQNVINLTSTLQSGATFFVSSGTVANLNTSFVNFPPGSVAILDLYGSTRFDGTATVGGGNSLVLQSPGNISSVVLNSPGQNGFSIVAPASTTFTGPIFVSSEVITGAGGLNVTFGVAVGSMTASSATVTGGFTAGSAVLNAPLPVTSGGTGTSTPGLVQGTNITISGSWPNQTINSSGGSGASLSSTNTWTANQNFVSSVTVTSTNSVVGLLVQGNALNYGTNAPLGGAFETDCNLQTTQGNCGQFYSHQSTQTALDGAVSIVVDNPGYNERALYIQSLGQNNSPVNGIRIDGYQYAGMTLEDTTRNGDSINGIFQVYDHNNALRLERRISGQFENGLSVAASTAPGIVAINNDYGVPQSTLEVAGNLSIGEANEGVPAPLHGMQVQGYSLFQSSMAIIGTGGPNLFSASTAATGVSLVSISSTPAINPGDYLVNVSSVTGVLVFGVQNNSHVISSGTTPSVSSCGTSPSMDPNSTDFAGTINTGSASPTACTLTFAFPFANTPVCVVSDDLQTSEPAVTSRSASAITMTLGASLSSGHIFYICVGQKG